MGEDACKVQVSPSLLLCHGEPSVLVQDTPSRRRRQRTPGWSPTVASHHPVSRPARQLATIFFYGATRFVTEEEFNCDHLIIIVVSILRDPCRRESILGIN